MSVSSRQWENIYLDSQTWQNKLKTNKQEKTFFAQMTDASHKILQIMQKRRLSQKKEQKSGVRDSSLFALTKTSWSMSDLRSAKKREATQYCESDVQV